MNPDEPSSDLAAEDLTHAIVGAAFEVVNELGHGFLEKPYENALVHELGLRNLWVDQPESYDIAYKGHRVGTLVPGITVEREVVVDTKVIDKITDHERGQMLKFLRMTGLKVGLIINFKNAKLQWDRVTRSA